MPLASRLISATQIALTQMQTTENSIHPIQLVSTMTTSLVNYRSEVWSEGAATLCLFRASGRSRRRRLRAGEGVYRRSEINEVLLSNGCSCWHISYRDSIGRLHLHRVVADDLDDVSWSEVFFCKNILNCDPIGSILEDLSSRRVVTHIPCFNVFAYFILHFAPFVMFSSAHNGWKFE